jgi:hypothetical protein
MTARRYPASRGGYQTARHRLGQREQACARLAVLGSAIEDMWVRAMAVGRVSGTPLGRLPLEPAEREAPVPLQRRSS